MTSLKSTAWSGLVDVVRRHPFLCAVLLCVGVEVFTLGDEKYITPQSIMAASLMTALIAYVLIRPYLKKFRVPAAFCCGAISFAWGVLFSRSEKKGGLFAALVLACTIAALAIMYLKHRLSPENVTALIIFAGFGLYIAYIMYTLSVIRQTDVNYWSSDSGHAGYIKYLFNHHFALTDYDPRETWQFYHTPFFYYISAGLIYLVTSFGVEFETAAEVSQIVTLFSAMSIVITSHRLFRLFDLRGYALTAAMAVISLSNTILILSGSISNDITAAALELGAFYCAVKWYKDRKMLSIIESALCMGLGLMTKLSAWMAAPAIAMIFIVSFIILIAEEKPVKKCLVQFGAFLGISVPLGMWFPVYNLIRWGVPLGYIPEGGEDYYVGEWSVLQRLFTVSRESVSTPFLLQKNYLYEYNPIVVLMKSSADLQRLAAFNMLAPLLSITIIVSGIIVVISTATMVVSVITKTGSALRKKGGKKSAAGADKASAITEFAAVLLWLVTMVSYVVFCIKYPYTCTENVRYVIPVITLCALWFGRAAGSVFKNNMITRLKNYFCEFIAALYGFVFMLTFVFMGFD